MFDQSIYESYFVTKSLNAIRFWTIQILISSILTANIFIVATSNNVNRLTSIAISVVGGTFFAWYLFGPVSVNNSDKFSFQIVALAALINFGFLIRFQSSWDAVLISISITMIWCQYFQFRYVESKNIPLLSFSIFILTFLLFVFGVGANSLHLTPIYIVSNKQPTYAITSFCIFIFLSIFVSPQNFLPQLKSDFMNFRHRFERKLIKRFVQELGNGQRSVNLLERLGKLWRQRKGELILAASILITSIPIVPNLFLENSISFFANALKIYSAALALIIIVYLALQFVVYRQKHIVVPFISANPDNYDMNIIASMSTHIFVEELRQVGGLLNSRQVENLVDSSSANIEALFITSGQNQEILQQIESFANIPVSDKFTLTIGNLFSLLIRAFAQTKVLGKVQVREKYGYEIYMELETKDGHVLEIDSLQIEGRHIHEIDEISMREEVKKTIAKLMIKMNDGLRSFSSWESLYFFIRGIEASHKRHMWEAISFYRKAIHYERTRQNQFSIGHYHLGTAFISQGDMDLGLHHLRIADAYGPPSAETKYMLGLVLLYRDWDELHIDRSKFRKIISLAKSAVSLRHLFPEAYHLIGSAYYQRGKKSERLSFNQSKRNENPSRYYYTQSLYALGIALRQYKKELKKIIKKPQTFELYEKKHKRRVLQNFATAIHQYGDNFRSLRRHSLANSYYELFKIIQESNGRNLTDQGMNYCLSKNWQAADELLRRNILPEPHLRWHVDANFYMGWVYAGGVIESMDMFPSLIRQMVNFRKRQLPYVPKEIIGSAFIHLDYAIYQRPRYASRWSQIDWLPTFMEAFKLLKQKNVSQSAQEMVIAASEDNNNQINRLDTNIYSAPIDINNGYYYDQLLLWLSWRMHYLGYKNQDDELLSTYSYNENYINASQALEEPWSYFINLSVEIAGFRSKVVEFLKGIDNTNRVGGLQNAWRRLHLANEFHEKWEEVNEKLEAAVFSQGIPSKVTFAERWAIDVYSELSLLATRFLVEGKEIMLAQELAEQASLALAKWIQVRWNNVEWAPTRERLLVSASMSDYKFVFSPLVTRYQQATLYSWSAYSLIVKHTEIVSKALYLAEGIESDLDNQFLDKARQLTDSALKIHSEHPLALYTQAQIYSQQKTYSLAISTLHDLLNVISPFDPKSFTANWEVGQKDQKFQSNSQTHDIRSDLYYMERICGQRQFEDILDRYRIHMELASLYQKQGDFANSNEHRLLAIAWSPFHDLDAQNYFDLAKQLVETDQLRDALNAIDEIKSRYHQVPILTFSLAKRVAPDVLRCTINARLANHETAILQAESLIDSFFSSHKYIYESFLDPANYQYLIEVEDNADGFYEIFSQVLTSTNLYLESLSWDNNEEYSETFDENEVVYFKRLCNLASCYLDTEGLSNLIVAITNDVDKGLKVPNQIICGRVVRFICEESFRLLSSRSELLNSIAFSLAETKLKMDYADQIASVAVNTMAFLHSFVQPAEREEHSSISYNLAQFYDTKGWINYRMGKYQEARKNFNQSLEFNLRLSITSYHLARLGLTELEQKWQEMPLDNKNLVFGEVSHQISNIIREIGFHLSSSYRLDKPTGRLKTNLNILNEKYIRYREDWEKLLSP